jgi:hypothetical protein
MVSLKAELDVPVANFIVGANNIATFWVAADGEVRP